ncbi:MAG: hypothetical protein ABSA13_14320 [Beijerinckiaceae bacterium]
MQLPPRMTISQFEARLRIALESVSLQKFYETAAGLDCAARGKGARFTAYPGNRRSAALEIVSLKPRNRQDISRLVAIIEQILANFEAQ